jgi:hypothetical protein
MSWIRTTVACALFASAIGIASAAPMHYWPLDCTDDDLVDDGTLYVYGGREDRG